MNSNQQSAKEQITRACLHGDYRAVEEIVSSNHENRDILAEKIIIYIMTCGECSHIELCPPSILDNVNQICCPEICPNCGIPNTRLKQTYYCICVDFLRLSVVSGKPKMVELALRYLPRKSESSNPLGLLGLSKGSKEEMKEIIRLVCQEGYSVNCATDVGENPLHLVSSISLSVHAVEALIEAGSDVNQNQKYGQTPLLLAIKQNNKDVVECLLQNGALPDIECLDSSKSSIMKLMFDYGCTFSQNPSFSSESILSDLHSCSVKNMPKVAEFLIRTGYRFTKIELEDIFDSILEVGEIDELYEKQMLTLQHLSANAVRRCLKPDLYGNLKKMDFLPGQIKDTILYL